MLAGLIPSLSETPEARIVTVQVSPGVKSTAGSSVNDVRPEPAVAPCGPLESQAIVNQLAAVVTGSLKLTVMFAFAVTAAAPFAGAVEVTEGAVSVTTPSQRCAAVAALRGAGVPVLKSVALSSVSVQPCPPRKAARAAVRDGAGPDPSKKFAPLDPVP